MRIGLSQLGGSPTLSAGIPSRWGVSTLLLAVMLAAAVPAAAPDSWQYDVRPLPFGWVGLEGPPLGLRVGDEAGPDTLVKRLEYAPHGGVVRVEVPYLDPDGLVYSREYDPARQWIDRIGLHRAAAPWLDFQYAYQPNGNVAAIAHPGFGGIDGEAFSYDALDRLTAVDYGAVGNIAYGYDCFGNLERRTVGLPPELCDETSFDFRGAMGEQNRLPAGAGFEYDAAGNLESIQPSAGEVEAMFYDPENRLGGYERRIWDDAGGVWRTVAAEMNFYGDGFERVAHRSWHYQLDTCWDTGIVTDTRYLAGPNRPSLDGTQPDARLRRLPVAPSGAKCL